MLINFIFSNYRSYLQESIFSLQAATNDDLYESTNTFEAPSSLLGKGENRLLKSAVIFGANASGKSNLLKALSFMHDAIMASRHYENGISKLNLEQYLYLKTESKPKSGFQIDFIHDQNYYEYSFIVEQDRILEERFAKRGLGETGRLSKISTLFYRKNNELIEGIHKKEILDSVIIKNNILLISVGKNMKTKFIEDFDSVYKFFDTVEMEVDGNFNNETLNCLQENKELALKILQESDIGLNDVEIIDEKLDIDEQEFSKNRFASLTKIARQKKLHGMLVGRDSKSEALHLLDIVTKFNIYDEAHNVVDVYHATIFGDRGFNSQGTEKLLKILGVIIKTLNNGGTLFIDEADANLHYCVAKFIVDLFNSSYNNKNAQLVIIAHNPLIMETNLRKDQIYFVEKEKFGGSKLYSLAEFKNVRKEHSVYKRYLAGYYKALPNINLNAFEGLLDEA